MMTACFTRCFDAVRADIFALLVSRKCAWMVSGHLWADGRCAASCDKSPFRVASDWEFALNSGYLRLGVVNTAATLLARGASVLYSLFVVGWASRHISASDTANLLLLFNAVAAVGLLQAGLGGYVIRAVAYAHSQRRPLGELAEVRFAFLLLCGISTLAMTGLVLFGSHALVQYLPIFLLTIVGTVANFADMVRLGTERSRTTTYFMLGAYAFNVGAWAVVARLHLSSVSVVALLAYSAPSIGAIASFAFLTREREFRALINPFNRVAVGSMVSMLKTSSPMFVASISSSMFVNTPLIARGLHLISSISASTAVVFRVEVGILNVFYAMLQPSIPTLVRLKHQESAGTFIRGSMLWIGGFLVAAMAIAACFYLGVGTFAALWVKSATVDKNMIGFWSIVLLLWMINCALVQYVQFIFSTITAAAATFIMPFGALCEAYYQVLSGRPVVIEYALGTGIGAAVVVASLVFATGMLRQPNT